MRFVLAICSFLLCGTAIADDKPNDVGIVYMFCTAEVFVAAFLNGIDTPKGACFTVKPGVPCRVVDTHRTVEENYHTRYRIISCKPEAKMDRDFNVIFTYEILEGVPL